MRRGRRVGSVWPPTCACRRGRRVALSSSRSRHFWTRAAGRTCADRVRLTEAPQRTRESSLCTCIRRCKLCRFVKPFVLRPLPKGPVAKAVIVYFMACKYSISGETRVHMCAPQSTRHASSLHRSVAGSHGHASLLSPLSGTRELRTRTRHGRARRSPHAARTITFQHTRHYTEFYIAPLPLAGRCIASFRGQQVTSPRLV